MHTCGSVKLAHKGCMQKIEGHSFVHYVFSDWEQILDKYGKIVPTVHTIICTLFSVCGGKVN